MLYTKRNVPMCLCISVREKDIELKMNPSINLFELIDSHSRMCIYTLVKKRFILPIKFAPATLFHFGPLRLF